MIGLIHLGLLNPVFELAEQLRTAKIVSQSTLFAADGDTVCAFYVCFGKVHCFSKSLLKKLLASKTLLDVSKQQLFYSTVTSNLLC